MERKIAKKAFDVKFILHYRHEESKASACKCSGDKGNAYLIINSAFQTAVTFNSLTLNMYMQLDRRPSKKAINFKNMLCQLQESKEGKANTTDTATCRHCKKSVKSKESNTTNLFSHLKFHHPMKYADEESSSSSKISSSQVTIKEALEKCKKYQRHGEKWEELTDSVTYCLAKDMLPMYSVEGCFGQKNV